ncbi:transposase family protein [Nostoc flagelliforme]|uniref:transposase family protein n=1 Tax=Nostoc flagelliforme TaxID=1306274 RepID=UPI00298E2201|nr:transposase family protein [Nostoc flagelliforme]
MKLYLGGKNISTPRRNHVRRLTSEQKARNKEFSSKRIFVEQSLELVKIFRVAQQRFPLNSQSYEQVILTICGLVRLRIGSLVLPIS